MWVDLEEAAGDLVSPLGHWESCLNLDPGMAGQSVVGRAWLGITLAFDLFCSLTITVAPASYEVEQQKQIIHVCGQTLRGQPRAPMARPAWSLTWLPSRPELGWWQACPCVDC